MHLRPIDVAEIDALAVLWHKGWGIGHAAIAPPALVRHRDLASFQDRIANDLTSFLVAEQHERVAGFIRIVGDELDQFYVAPDKIGQGIAAPLMYLAEQAMRDRGVIRAHLIASVGNHRAIRFYKKMGWQNLGPREEGVTTREGPFRVSVVRMEKQLSSAEYPR